MTEESWFMRIWRLCTPEIIYQCCIMVVQFAACMYYGMPLVEQYIENGTTLDTTGMTEALLQIIVQYALLLQTIGAVIAIVFLFRMYYRDYKKRRFFYDRTSIQPISWLLLIPTGILFSIAGNFILNVTDFAQNSESFQTAETLLFSGPMIIQIIGIGIVIPICEELVFRGLMYMRMRQYLDVNYAILVSAVMFGLMHGNLVQGLYGFSAGILFAYVYEKYGSLKAPICVHMCANLFSLVMTACNPSFNNQITILFIGLAASAATIGMAWYIDHILAAKIIYPVDAH